MSMSKRRDGQQQEIWVPTHTLPETPSHPLYTQLNRLLCEHGFDSLVEEQCPVLRAQVGRSQYCPRGVFPHAHDRLLRGLGVGAGHCLARRRFLGPA